MPTAIPDLWPESFGEVQELTPAAILREQGQRLAQKTRNLVIGQVRPERTFTTADPFSLQFVIACPVLAFSRPMLSVVHGVQPYPARITDLLKPEKQDQAGRAVREVVTATSADEFLRILHGLFTADTTVALIRSLLAQAKDFAEQ